MHFPGAPNISSSLFIALGRAAESTLFVCEKVFLRHAFAQGVKR
jgi:hypothetical protein